jgi:hypothetical protein
VLAATLLLMAGTWILATFELPGLAPPPEVHVRCALRSLRAEWLAWAIAIVSGGAVGGILVLSAWHLTSQGWVSGGCSRGARRCSACRT